MKGQRVVFIGDSTTRQLYWMSANRLDHYKQEVATLDFYVSDTKQRDLAMEAEGVNLEFIWDPWLNSSRLHDELARFRPFPDRDAQDKLGTADRDSAALLVLGAPGLWAARHGGVDFLEIFGHNIDRIRPYLSTSLGATMGARSPKENPSFSSPPNQILLIPVPEPLYEQLSTGRMDTITPERIDALNSYLGEFSEAEQSHVLWVFNKMIRGKHEAYGEDGLHIKKGIGATEVSLFLNVRCNAGLRKDMEQSHPTCCIPHRVPNALQVLFLILGVIASPAVLFSPRQREGITTATLNPMSIRVLGRLLAAAAFCYLADRSHVFIKVERTWSSAFLWLFFGFLVLSLGSMRTRKTPKPTQPRFLPREQTDEWKGWMQVFALLYDYYNGGQSLVLYKLMRLGGAIYIFLSVYGHTTYFLESNDLSLRRFGSVLIRLNLLDCLLSFVLFNSWTSYWFIPVVTFWFCVVYATLSVCRGMNGNLGGIMSKAAIAMVAANILIAIPGFLDLLCKPIQIIFRTAWDMDELRSHLAGDSLTPFFAIIAAATASRITTLRLGGSAPNTGKGHQFADELDDTFRQILSTERDPTKEALWPVIGFGSVAITILFTSILLPSTVFHDQDTYGTFHPFLSWVPVLALVYLRNSYPALKSRVLALPAFLGAGSLETYMLHHHILLANGSFSLLRMWPAGQHVGPVGKVLEILQPLMLTVVLIWASERCREATQAAAGIIAGTDHDVENCSLDKSMQTRSRLKGSRIWGDLRGRFACLCAVLWIGNLICGS